MTSIASSGAACARLLVGVARQHAAALAIGLAASVGVAATASAEVIGGLGFLNRSSADALIEQPLRVREFATGSAFVGSTADARSASFTHRMTWTSAQRVEAPGIVLASWGNTVAYDLAFTVEDPTGRGYALDIDAVFRGWLTAHWSGNSGPFPSLAFAAGTLMAAQLDSGAGFVTLPGLETDIEVAMADDDDPRVDLLVADSAHVTAGTFSGTRDFTLRFTALTDNTSAALQNLNSGEVGMRFGLAPTSSRFVDVVYPGLDGESAADHGHRVTVTARYGTANAVSEPGGPALVAIAMAGLCLRPRRGREAPGAPPA